MNAQIARALLHTAYAARAALSNALDDKARNLQHEASLRGRLSEDEARPTIQHLTEQASAIRRGHIPE